MKTSALFLVLSSVFFAQASFASKKPKVPNYFHCVVSHSKVVGSLDELSFVYFVKDQIIDGKNEFEVKVDNFYKDFYLSISYYHGSFSYFINRNSQPRRTIFSAQEIVPAKNSDVAEVGEGSILSSFSTYATYEYNETSHDSKSISLGCFVSENKWDFFEKQGYVLSPPEVETETK